MTRQVMRSLAAIVALVMACPAFTQPKPGCLAAVPASLTASPATWLGGCQAGKAEGLGVLRTGRAEPFQFFFGQMHAGEPVKGLMRVRDGWEDAIRFDAHYHNIGASDQVAFDALYKLATRAANATAQRFAAAGNRGSAAYYQRLAKQIQDGEPE